LGSSKTNKEKSLICNCPTSATLVGIEGKFPNETFQPENTLDRFLCSYRHLLVGGMSSEPIQVKKRMGPENIQVKNNEV
jgi:hypothetical protein